MVFNLAADATVDPRAIVLQKDVSEVISESWGSFDSIILDVDNGPSASRLRDHLVGGEMRPLSMRRAPRPGVTPGQYRASFRQARTLQIARQ
jgi:hypothetical protein